MPPAFVRGPSPFPRVPRQSRVSANDKGDNELILIMHRSPGILFTAEETPGKPQLGDRLMKAVRLVVASNEIHYLEMKSVG